MVTLEFLLRSHAITHGLDVGESEGRFSLEYNRLHGLSDDQLRIRPNGWNSMAWLLWHMARTEDVAINVVVADRPQVFDTGHWAEQLNVHRRDIGTGMSDGKVEALSEAIDIPALREYRMAIGRATQAVARSLPAAEWDRVPGEEIFQKAIDQGAFAEEALWVAQLWSGKSKAWFFYWVAVGHNVMHLGQAGWVKEMILQKRGR